jgi:deferrochelatase/peroxidase EfeB
VSRRGFLGGLGAVGAGAALAASGGLAACSDDKATHTSGGASGQVVPVNGAHQAGIATPAQDRVAFAALDVTSRDPHQLAQLLDQWTASARAMTQGSVVPGGMADQLAAPADTGEAYGLSPAKLTVTIGFGPSLFDHRFGLAARRPQALEELPPLPGDELDPAFVGGDLCIQACSDDPQVAFHAVRNLARQGTGTVVHRWMQLGFGRTSSTTSQQLTPRNLMGFKDGTRNISSDDTGLMDGHVWVGESDQPWLRGGSFVVARRIKMLLEIWDRNMLADQEATFGRAKLSGAPLTGDAERDVPDFAAKGPDGELVIPADAHVRLASPEHNRGVRILRRGYSFTDGIDPESGSLLGGLFFLAYMKDPQQFVTLQRSLGRVDALSEYIRHIGSAVFACPPGTTATSSWRDHLFS